MKKDFKNKIITGDFLKNIKEIPEKTVDFIVTSPPYADTVQYGKDVPLYSNDKYVDWMTRVFIEVYRVAKDDASFILNINDNVKAGERSLYVYKLVISIAENTNWIFHDRYVWHKKSGLPMTGERRLNDRMEYIFHFVKNKKFKSYIDRVRAPYKNVSLIRFRNAVHGNHIVLPSGKVVLSSRKPTKGHPKGSKPTTVFRFNNSSAIRKQPGELHPATYHPELPGFFIKWLTKKGDLVLDPFMGAGTTGMSAVELNRNFLGFEINPTYSKISKARIKRHENSEKKYLT